MSGVTNVSVCVTASTGLLVLVREGVVAAAAAALAVAAVVLVLHTLLHVSIPATTLGPLFSTNI